jgi:HPt (histidine-containing phosphotransfer) domain-containing protein
MEEEGPDLERPSGQLDLRRFRELSDGEADSRRVMIRQYLDQAWSLFEAAAHAVETRDARTLRLVAHTLGESSRTVGAEAVALVAAALEASATDAMRGTPLLLGRALACLIATEREFERFLEEDPGREAA